jgi:predicted alpha-1,6-mannanase (GH76 family)
LGPRASAVGSHGATNTVPEGSQNGDVSDTDRDRAALTRLLTYFRPRSGRWKMASGEAWQPALALDAVINTYQRTGDPACRTVVERSFSRYRGRRMPFYDDDGWFLNTWLRAYEVIGDDAYLEEAASLFTELTGGWDSTCGGGLWWRKDRTYKNAITNELFLLGAGRLHRLAAGGDHGEWALRAWRWFDGSGLVNPAGLVNDGLDGACANNGGTTWTYNQGVILGGLAELWRATGDRAYLDRAEAIADAALAALVDADGVLTEPGEPGCDADQQIFKGVFAQGLARLHHAGGKPAYASFLRANADAVWAGRDERDGVGLRWAGPARDVNGATQASACLLLGAVALLDRGGETPT